MTTPEIDLTDPELHRDPFRVYGEARERAPVARLHAPGFGPMWAITRYEQAKAMLADPRFEVTAASYQRPDVPEDCLLYLHTMQEMEGNGHTRLRRLVAPAFTARRAAEFRPRIERIVAHLLDDLPAHDVDLLRHFAQPLPMEVICELVGIPDADRPPWRTYGAAIVTGAGAAFAEAVPGIIRGAKAAVTARQADPGDDLISDLIQAQTEDGDRLTDTELITLVWHLVLSGQTPTNLITNAVAALLAHPDQLSALHENPSQATEELIRWCGPQLLSIPRYAKEDVKIDETLIPQGDPVTAALASVNRDPRAFTNPDQLDLTRPPTQHLGFAHGPHFCLGAALARVQTEVALTNLLSRYPNLTTTAAEQRAPDPGTWRLTSLQVTR
jgi:cytochrome P450